MWETYSWLVPEAVAADAKFVSQVVGDRVAPCFFGHGGVERGVEDSNLRRRATCALLRLRPERAGCAAVLKREVVDPLDNFLGEQGGWVNFSAPCTTRWPTACSSRPFVTGLANRCRMRRLGTVGADVSRRGRGQHCLPRAGGRTWYLQGGRTSVHNENKHESIFFRSFLFVPFSHFSTCVRDG